MKNLSAAIISMILFSAVFSTSAISVPEEHDSLQEDIYSIRMGSVRSGPVYTENAGLHYNVRNTGTEHIYDARTILWIPELDYYLASAHFDMDRMNSHRGFIHDYAEGIEPGYYLARISFSSDHARSSRWIWLDII